MQTDNRMIPKLLLSLTQELETRALCLFPQVLDEGDRQRQTFVHTGSWYWIAVLGKHIMGRTASVVCAAQLVEKCCTLRFYRPLSQRAYNRLAASEYTPILRSNIYLTVGIGKSGGIPYAYAEVKLPQYGNVIDLFNALVVLGKELGHFLNQL